MRIKLKLLLLAIPVFLLAQSSISDKLGGLIQAGDEHGLRSYFDQSVEIITPENDGVYSQNQAEQVLKSFFNKYPCNDFKVDHLGSSAGGSQFVIGTYNSGSKSFRTSIFLKQVDQKFLIQELTFEE
ncbi:DUF4783 domain-containing protein [bacterium]|nr:DUF4783 domain-containing protein [bacterium]